MYDEDKSGSLCGQEIQNLLLTTLKDHSATFRSERSAEEESKEMASIMDETTSELVVP